VTCSRDAVSQQIIIILGRDVFMKLTEEIWKDKALLRKIKKESLKFI